MEILVLNSGSSSIKFEVIDVDRETPLLRGEVERIGAGGSVLTQLRLEDGVLTRISLSGGRASGGETGGVVSHEEALQRILEHLFDPGSGGLGQPHRVGAVGHRVVHGGERFREAAVIDREVLDGIRACFDLAPLHNPHNLAGIEAALRVLPSLPQVAVFDTAFHATLPPAAWHYALPREVYLRHGIRRYGFHGTSHRYVARRAGELLGKPPSSLQVVSLHLGNGASACALAGGVSVETTMGFTPLEGLVMGTRSGDVDPAAVLHWMARDGLSVAEASTLLNRNAGLLGLSGTSGDMRDLLALATEGDDRAQLALDVYVHRIRKAIGASVAVLGEVHAIAFTGGVGENAALVRSRVLRDMSVFGVDVDGVRNLALTGGREGNFGVGPTALLVIRSGEELTIARETQRVLGGPGEATAASDR